MEGDRWLYISEDDGVGARPRLGPFSKELVAEARRRERARKLKRNLLVGAIVIAGLTKVLGVW